MVEYLDKIGLAYLWGKIKTSLSGLVSNISVNGNNIRITKGNGNTDITIPYATTAGSATKVGSSTVGSSTKPVYMNSGTPTPISSFPEAYLSWGGKNWNDSCGPLDAALIYELGAPKTFWVKPAGVIIDYSTDGGETWIDYGVSDSVKNILFSTGDAALLTGKTNVQSVDNLLRITLEFPQCGLYAALRKFAINIARRGAIDAYCTIRGRTKTDVEAGNDSWTTFANKALLAGESGWNIINVSKFRTYQNNKSHYGEIQFIFGSSVYVSGSYGVRVNRIIGYGDSGWSFPSNMARTGHLYAFDASQNAVFPESVTASKFLKSGGTSSQFLKADGSVDSTAYLPANGNAATATKATQDGSGNNIETTYQKKADVPAAITNTEMDNVLEDNSETNN